MKRPLIITIICVVGYLSVLFTFPQVFSPSVKKLGVLMPAVFGILVSIQFIAYVGLWYFKQWGVLLFLISYFAKILFYILTEQTGVVFYVNTFLNLLFAIILIRFYKLMGANL